VHAHAYEMIILLPVMAAREEGEGEVLCRSAAKCHTRAGKEK